MTWTELKKQINNLIKPNNNKAITGQILQNVLNMMVDTTSEKTQRDAFVLTDSAYEMTEKIRWKSYRSAPFRLPGFGFSPVGATASLLNRPFLSIDITHPGTINVHAISGSEVLASKAVSVGAGGNIISTQDLNIQKDCRIYIETVTAYSTYEDTNGEFVMYQYDLTSGASELVLYNISIFCLPQNIDLFPNDVNTYPGIGKYYYKFQSNGGSLTNYAWGLNKTFTGLGEVQNLKVFSLYDMPAEIILVKDDAPATSKTGKINLRRGYNDIDLYSIFSTQDWNFKLFIKFGGLFLFAPDPTGNIGLQYNTSTNVVEPSDSFPPISISCEKDVLFSEDMKHQLMVSSSSDLYTYFYDCCFITSQNRLKDVRIYAAKEGRVYIDFYSPPSAGWHTVYPSGFANTTNNYVNVKPGLNIIPAKDIQIPFFHTYAYVGVRAEAGVLMYTQTRTGSFMGNEIHNGVAAQVPYRFAYTISTESFDLNQLLSGQNITLPPGVIEISEAITVNGATLKGEGIQSTMIYSKVTSGPSIIVNRGTIKDFTLMGRSNIRNERSGKLNTLTANQTLAGINTNGSAGIDVRTSETTVENVTIVYFDYFGFRNQAPARVAHNRFHNIGVSGCGVGFIILAEYGPMTNLTASQCVAGIRVGAGNVFISNSSFNDNNVGLYMWKTGNDSHGSFTCCNFNHSRDGSNSNYSIILDEISHGETFVGCHVFQGDIFLNKSIGFNWTGGIIDCHIYVKGGKTQALRNTAFQDAYWDRTNGIIQNYGGVQSYLKLSGNFFMFETGENDNILNN